MFEIFDHWELKLPLDHLLPHFYYDQLKNIDSEFSSFSHIKRTPFPYFLQSNINTIKTAEKFSSIPLIDHLVNFENRCTQHVDHKNGKIFDISLFLKKNIKENATQIPSSIVISHLERNNYILDKTIAQLSEKYRVQFGINAYMTPPHGKTFNCHKDPHDIFVLQIYGSKKWNIYKNRNNPEDKLQILLEVELNPGDILFVPEGFYHEAVSLDSLSLHFSFGFYEASPVKILDWIKKDFPNLNYSKIDKTQMINLNFLYQLRHKRSNQTQSHFLVFESQVAKKLVLFTSNKEIHIDFDLKEWLHDTLGTLGNTSERVDLAPLHKVLSDEIKRVSLI
ncbi:MAG: cupin domain-containing protein [Bdellovibrionales bacterium]|nr:cupin domain-containing protein [Bdellovibrionales bacterium]